MSRSLVEDLPGGPGKGGLRVWLKSEGYARRLLLGPGSDPWEGGAARCAAFLSQVQGLLRADVAVVDIGCMLRSWLRLHPGLAAEMGARPRPTHPLRRLLEEEGPRHLLGEVAGAVGATLQGQVPMVLAMPAPGAWLCEAQRMAGRTPAQPDPDAVEDAAMYVADFLRCLAAHPVGGLLLEENEAPGPAGCYQPVLNAARHYRWAAVSRGAAAADARTFDAVIGTAPFAQGRDVGEALFAGAPLPALAETQFFFAEIPEDQPAETVMDALARLRA